MICLIAIASTSHRDYSIIGDLLPTPSEIMISIQANDSANASKLMVQVAQFKQNFLALSTIDQRDELQRWAEAGRSRHEVLFKLKDSVANKSLNVDRVTRRELDFSKADAALLLMGRRPIFHDRSTVMALYSIGFNNKVGEELKVGTLVLRALKSKLLDGRAKNLTLCSFEYSDDSKYRTFVRRLKSL